MIDESFRTKQPRGDDLDNATVDESDGETKAWLGKYKNTVQVSNQFQGSPRQKYLGSE